MAIILIGQYRNGFISLVIPKNSNIGVATFTDVEPVMANTKKTTATCQLLVNSQRDLSFSKKFIDTDRITLFRNHMTEFLP